MARFKVKPARSVRTGTTVRSVLPGFLFTLQPTLKRASGREAVNMGGRSVQGEYFLKTDEGAVYMRDDIHLGDDLSAPSDVTGVPIAFGDLEVEGVFEVEEFILRSTAHGTR